jgi:hypothetical protein
MLGHTRLRSKKKEGQDSKDSGGGGKFGETFMEDTIFAEEI